MTEDARPPFRRQVQPLLRNVFYEPYEPSADHYALPLHPPEMEHTDELGSPVPPPAIQRGYGPDHSRYLTTGRQNFEVMVRTMAKVGSPLAADQRILDFGCAAGRMTRWLRTLGDGPQFWGVDVLGEDLFWAKQYLTPFIKFAVTTRQPPVPFEDRYFDFVFACSVFTHIDDLVEAWLLELRRILRPSGCLYLTIMDESSIEIIANERPSDFVEKVLTAGDAELAAAYHRYAATDFGVFNLRRSQMHSLEPYSPQTFYRSQYFIGIVEQFFEVLAYEQRAYGYQSAVVLRKPPR
jgi:SAM-dependent methyltransferase